MFCLLMPLLLLVFVVAEVLAAAVVAAVVVTLHLHYTHKRYTLALCTYHYAKALTLHT